MSKYLSSVFVMTAMIGLSACASLPGGNSVPDFSSLSDDELKAIMVEAKAEAASEEAEASAEAEADKTELYTVLFSGIEDKMVSNGAPTTRRSAEDITCLRYYANSVKYMNQPDPMGYAKGFAKTLFAGSLAGLTAGGIAAVGINSTVVETMAATTANQVVYSNASSGWDRLVGQDEKDDPLLVVAEAANEVGCPEPSAASMKAITKVSKKLS